MDSNPTAQYLIGRCVRSLREERSLTLEKLALEAGISYQYLSGIEHGKENFSVVVLESLASALGIPLKTLISLAYGDIECRNYPKVNPKFFRNSVPLPQDLTISQLELAMNQAQEMIHRINRNLISEVGKPLQSFIQGNNFSGLVSNIFSDALSDKSQYKHNHEQRYPDLINRSANVGLEVKATIHITKGGESHNGHSGWHTVTCYEITEDHDMTFTYVMFAYLNGYQSEEPDWEYRGSRVNEATGSRRTETYITNLYGKTKLRDGSVYMDLNKVNHSRWQVKRRSGVITPPWSIFAEVES